MKEIQGWQLGTSGNDFYPPWHFLFYMGFIATFWESVQTKLDLRLWFWFPFMPKTYLQLFQHLSQHREFHLQFLSRRTNVHRLFYFPYVCSVVLSSRMRARIDTVLLAVFKTIIAGRKKRNRNRCLKCWRLEKCVCISCILGISGWKLSDWS